MSPNINERLRLELREFFRQLRQANYSPSFLKFLPKEVRENSLNYLRSLHLPEFETEEVKNDPTGTKLVERLNYHLRAGSRMDKGVFFQSIGLVQKDAEEFVKDQERPIEGKATEQTQEQAEEQKPGTDQQGSTTQQGAGGQTQSKSGFGLPGLAGGTGQTPRQPRIHTVPQVETPEEPKTTLAVANKSGHIVEERTITPTSTKISKPETPNIVLANKSGVVNEGFRGEKILSIANKGGQVVGEKLVKDLESNTQIGIQKGLARAGRGLEEMAKGFGRGIIGPGVSSIYQVGGRVARGSINAGTRLSNEISRSRMRLGGRRKGPSKRIWLLLLGMFFFLMFTSAFAPPGKLGSGTGVTIGGGSNLLQCTFTRSGSTVNHIKSAKLAGIFQEVADKTGVPASVLASVALHETQGFVTGAEDNHDAFGNNGVAIVGPDPSDSTKSACIGFKTSPTGALGLMQVEPPSGNNFNTIVANPTGFSTGVQTGLDKMGSGKTIDSLTLNDFCDIKTNVYMGAGVLISKNGGKPPTSLDEIKNAVCGYYGSCQYGPYNYGIEVANDWQNCTSPSITIGKAGCPIPDGQISCGSLAGSAACHHCGAGYGSAQYLCADPVCSNKANTFNWNEYAIDVVYPNTSNQDNIGKAVYLPTIKGEQVTWVYDGESRIQTSNYLGYIRLFKSQRTADGTVYSLQLLHVQPNNPGFSGPVQSGQVGGYIEKIDTGFYHVHVVIGANVNDNTNNPGWCSTQWIYADKDAGMCTN